MKLRFHANTLRLRLSRPDLAKLAEAGSVEEAVTFAPGQTLIYRIESGPAPHLSASFDGSRVSVTVPHGQAKQWMETDQIGIEASTESLKVLIEKDFQCLHSGVLEDAAAFPNPAAKGL